MPPAMTIRIGQGSCRFAIEHPVPIPGFGARTEGSVGDLAPPVRASAVAFEEVVVIALDLIGVDPGLVSAISQRLPDKVTALVTATHTHAGPGVTPGRLAGHSDAARAAVIDSAVAAATDALITRAPATLQWMDPVWPGLAHDRRRGVRSAAARLTGLRWRHRNQPGGWLLSYPCHPTVIGPTNRHLSPDYPGGLRAALEADGGTAVFLTGCAGDLNAGHRVAASYRLDEAPGRTPADAARFGEHLARAVAAAAWQPVDTAPGVRVATAAVAADYGPLTDQTPAAERSRWEAELATADPGTAALLQSWIAWSHRTDASTCGRYPLPVAVLELGEVNLVFLPGEPFLAAETALAGSGRTMVAGYYADVPGYLPAEDDYPQGGYEVTDAHRYYGSPAPFRPGTLERLIAAAEQLRRRGGSDD